MNDPRDIENLQCAQCNGTGKNDNAPGTDGCYYCRGLGVVLKPDQITVVALDYSRCNQWIELKYGINTRDYFHKFAGAEFGGYSQDVPYCDFWHWFLDTYDTLVHNGCYIGFMIEEDTEVGDKFPDEIRKILGYWRAEFGQYMDDWGCVKVWIEW